MQSYQRRTGDDAMTIYIFAAGIAVGAVVASIAWAVWTYNAMGEE